MSVSLSIVIPSFNSGRYLPEALRSVMEQDVRDCEIIVVDGGSTDNTVSILESFQGSCPIRWLSEPDDGIYHALNKGIQLAEGDWVGWLNCDDLYPGETFKRVIKVATQSDVGVICGDAELFENDQLECANVVTRFEHYRGARLTDSWENLKIAHLNACFFHKKLLNDAGPFNENYEIVADRDYLFRLMKLAPQSRHLGAVTYRYRVHRESITMARFDDTKQRVLSSVPEKVRNELRDLCEAHLAEAVVSQNIRTWCLSTYRRISAQQAASVLLKGHWGEFGETTRSALSIANYMWIPALLKALLRESLHRWWRRGR